jgi:hypothetical protein
MPPPSCRCCCHHHCAVALLSLPSPCRAATTASSSLARQCHAAATTTATAKLPPPCCQGRCRSADAKLTPLLLPVLSLTAALGCVLFDKSVVPDNHPCVIVDTFKSRSLLSRHFSQQLLRLELEAHIACALCMASFLWVDLTWIPNWLST